MNNNLPLVKMFREGRYARLIFNPIGPHDYNFQSFISTIPTLHWSDFTVAVNEFGRIAVVDDCGMSVTKVPIKLAPMAAAYIIEAATPDFEDLPAFKRAHPEWPHRYKCAEYPYIVWVNAEGKINQRIDYKQMISDAEKWLCQQGFSPFQHRSFHKKRGE